jgi:hypothetical protein
MSAHGREKEETRRLELQQDGCHESARSFPSAFTFNSLSTFPKGRTLSDDHRTIPCRGMQNAKLKRQKEGEAPATDYGFHRILHF